MKENEAGDLADVGYRVIYLDSPKNVQPCYKFLSGTLSIQCREAAIQRDDGNRLRIGSILSVKWLHLGCHGWLIQACYPGGFLLLAVVWFSVLGRVVFHPLRMRAMKRAMERLLA